MAHITRTIGGVRTKYDAPGDKLAASQAIIADLRRKGRPISSVKQADRVVVTTTEAGNVVTWAVRN